MSPFLTIPIAIGGYLLGSVPTGVLAAHLFGWPDPRRHGSGHTGATNAYRAAGVVGFALVFAGDVGKGILAVWLASLIDVWAIPIAGVAAVVGHNWPVWTKFEGGMGLATSAAMIGTQFWPAPFIAGILWLAFYAVTRHKTWSSIASVLFAPIIIGIMGVDAPTLVLVIGCCIIIAYRHLEDWIH